MCSIYFSQPSAMTQYKRENKGTPKSTQTCALKAQRNPKSITVAEKEQQTLALIDKTKG